jgi:hypothetical protein
MFSHTRRHRSSDRTRLSQAIKSAYENAAADDYGKKTTGHEHEKDTARAKTLTLDDFGGRSDALGG